MNELKNEDDIIIFIDEIHTIVGAGGAEGAIDASNILKPALARGEIKCIGATTIDEYRKHIEKDAALERRFQTVNVEPPSKDETVNILFGLRDKYESHHKVKITDGALYMAVDLSDRYISDRYMPDKAIDLIDEAAAKVRTLERKITQTEERNTRLYEDYVAGVVDKDDFDMMKERYIGELQNLREELQVQEQNQRILEKKANRYMDMVNHMEKYLDKREYNEALVQELVEYIEVYANGSIHVCFKCKDEFQQIAEEMEGVQIG